MRFQILSAALLAAGAAASVAGDNDTLDKIVKDMPDCAMRCYNEAAQKAGCKPEDFDCLCKSLVKTPYRMGACLAHENCKAPGADNALADICERMTDKPNKSEVEAASSVVAQAVATQTGISGAGAVEVGLGMLGAAGVVAAML